MTTDDTHRAVPPDRVLDDLIVQHLDGGLDPAGQRRLADLLATSVDARRTLATYLRLEGAMLRLAHAGLLGDTAAEPGVAAPAKEPTSAARPRQRVAASAAARKRNPWLWPTSLAIAAGLLVAVVISQPPRRAGWPGVAEADLDRCADNWLALAHGAEAETLVAIDAASAAEASGPDAEPSATPEGVATPPDWLIAALVDDAPDSAAPDAG